MSVSALNNASDTNNVEIVCYRDHDDKTNYEYFGNHKVIIGPKIPGCDMANKCQRIASGDIFMMIADDYVFESKGWDEEVIKAFDTYHDKIVMVWANDKCYRSGFAQAPFIHRNWVDVVGYFAVPYFPTQYQDNWWNDVSSKIDRKLFLRHVVIRHHNVTEDKTHKDYITLSKQGGYRRLYYTQDMKTKRQHDADLLMDYINSNKVEN